MSLHAPAPADDPGIVEYKDALLKAGVAIKTDEKTLAWACEHVTSEHARNATATVYPQVVDMIVHGRFEDTRGRHFLILPPDREALRLVRDALADSGTTIVGLSPRYVPVEFVREIEATAERLRMPLGPRSALLLPPWYRIFPNSGLEVSGARKPTPIPVFSHKGEKVDQTGGKGHITNWTGKKDNVVIDIPDPDSLGLPGPCYLNAYLDKDTSTSEIRPGVASLAMGHDHKAKTHAHKWKKFWAWAPDYSNQERFASVHGERCSVKDCLGTRDIKFKKLHDAVLLPQPEGDWVSKPGLKPVGPHAHAWQTRAVRWAGSQVFAINFLYCATCDAESWPKRAEVKAAAYQNYGPAVDEIVKDMKFPKDLGEAFNPSEHALGEYEWYRGLLAKPSKTDKKFMGLAERASKKHSKAIKAYNEAVAEANKKRRQQPLSVYLELAERVAEELGRSWKAPKWLLETEKSDEADGEAPED